MSHASLRNYVHTLRTLANTWPSPFRSSFSLELTAAIEKRVHQTESRRGRGRALPYPSSDPQSLAFTEKKSLSCLYVFFDLCYHWRIPLIGTKHERLFGKRGKISPPSSSSSSSANVGSGFPLLLLISMPLPEAFPLPVFQCSVYVGQYNTRSRPAYPPPPPFCSAARHSTGKRKRAYMATGGICFSSE